MHYGKPALPLIEDWYQELLDDAEAIENDTQRQEAIDALGSPEAFIANLKAQYVTPIVTTLQNNQEARETRTANRLAQEALTGLREAGNDANITEQGIIDLWTATVPLLEMWYQELLDDAEAIENDADREEAIAALGTPEAFIANLKAQYVAPILTNIQNSTEALGTQTANRLAQEALGAIREAGSDVNVTEAEIIRLWTEALPFIETWYQELLDDAEAIEDDAEREEALEALGSPEAFIANLKSQYVTPILTGIEQSTEALETQTANREAQDAIQGLQDVASDVNVTRRTILEKWREAIPFIRTWWQELHDDIVNNENLSDAQIRESLAELGSVEAFIGNIRSQYVTPILNNIIGTRFQNRSNRAQDRLNRAQFNLGGATSESDFERRRVRVIDAINAYYDAEEERIDNLELSEAELRDLRRDNNLARDQAIRRATEATNTFAEERIREEKRVADEIQDLRDDALENEQDRQEALTDLAEDSARRREEIEEDHQERLEDIRRRAEERQLDRSIGFERDVEDLLRESGVEISDELQDRLTQGLQRGQDLSSTLSQLGINLDTDTFGALSELTRGFTRAGEDARRQTLFDQQGAGIRQERAIADLEQDTARREQEINAQAQATAIAIETAIAPLLQQQSEAPQAQIDAAEAQTTAAEDISEASEVQATAAMDVAESTDRIASGLEGLPERLEGSFDNIFERLTMTLTDLFQVQAGIQGGVGQFLISQLAESGDRVEGLIGQTAGLALESLGIDPDQFAPSPRMTGEQGLMTDPTAPIPVEVSNTDEFASPARVARVHELAAMGLTPSEIAAQLPAIDAMTPRPIEPMAGAGVSQQMIQASSVSITAGSVSVNGGSVGGDERPMIIENRTTVELDGDKVGQSVGSKIVQQGANRRNLLGR